METYVMLPILLGLFIIFPKIGLVDYSLLPLVLLFFLLFFRSLTIRERNVVKVSRLLLFIFVCWIFAFVLALISTIYHQQIMAQLLFKPIRQIILLGILIAIFNLYSFKFRDILFAIVIAAFINSFVIYVQYFSGLLIPGSKGDFLLSPSFTEEFNVSYRKPGVFSGYPPAGIMALFGVISSLYLLYSEKRTYMFLLALPIVFTLFLTSRMAMLIGIALFLVLYLYTLIFKLRIFLSLTLLSVFVFSVFNYFDVNKTLDVNTFKIMFEVFINLSDGNGLSSKSATELADSYSYPIDNISTLLIGNGIEHKADNGLFVDSGIQILLFDGGVGALLTYHILFFIYLYICIKSKGIFIDNLEMLLVVIMFLVVFISNIKGMFLFSRGPVDALLIISAFFISCFSNRGYYEKN